LQGARSVYVGSRDDSHSYGNNDGDKQLHLEVESYDEQDSPVNVVFDFQGDTIGENDCKLEMLCQKLISSTLANQPTIIPAPETPFVLVDFTPQAANSTCCNPTQQHTGLLLGLSSAPASVSTF
jgi:hypothetical protein